MHRLTPRVCYVCVAALVALTAAMVLRSRGVRVLDDLPLVLELPDRVGAYEAQDVRFCQSESCLRMWRVSELTADGRCPVCGGPVDEVSLAEKRILPADTLVRRREYVNGSGESLMVSIVVSGREQKSLHRPQQCLPAQGYVIESGRVLRVPLAGRDPLAVMALNLRPAGGRAGRATYAYWFVGEGRETPYHLQRLWWMSRDRLLRQEAHRWAYVAVSVSRVSNAERTEKRLRQFIADLYPQLRRS